MASGFKSTPLFPLVSGRVAAISGFTRLTWFMAMHHWRSFWLPIGIPTFIGFTIFMKLEAAIMAAT